jgi:hypothetical protein
MLAVVLFDELRPPGGAQHSYLLQLRPKVDGAGAEILSKIDRVELQLAYFD